ncbi:MAG: hypothetical protein L6Q57_09480 [Alphaproteobacteria bacterium]|nr:hypothetical protein [Alphaproteobacteria bacterium]
MSIFKKLQPLFPSLSPGHVGDMNIAHINGNIAISTHLGLKEVLTPETVGKIGNANDTVCIINPGPSARTQEVLDYLNGGLAKDGRSLVRVLANAGYGMLSKGLNRAEYFVTHHPDNKVVGGIVGLGNANLEYLVASTSPAGADPANPSVIEHLQSKGREPKIWHPHVEGVTDHGDEKVSVGTGSGAPIAALALFAAMGYRKFEVFGMDGSVEYAVDLAYTPAMTAYLQGLKDSEMAVSVCGKVFTVVRDFWPQTLELMHFLRTYPDAVQSIKFSGNTANAAIFNSWDGQKFNCGPIEEIKQQLPGSAAPAADGP